MAIKKVKITISTLEESLNRFAKVFSDVEKGIVKKHTPIISFANFEIYMRTFTPKRMELLKTINLKKPKTILELAKITKRDFKNVYSDVKLLERYDLLKLEKTNSGLKPCVVYDQIELDIRIPLEA